jgi:hypothetical protein
VELSVTEYYIQYVMLLVEQSFHIDASFSSEQITHVPSECCSDQQRNFWSSWKSRSYWTTVTETTKLDNQKGRRMQRHVNILSWTAVSRKSRCLNCGTLRNFIQLKRRSMVSEENIIIQINSIPICLFAGSRGPKFNHKGSMIMEKK